MGIKNTLSNIEYLQEQREKREITEKEQREIEKDYKKTLKDTIKYYFKDIFDTCEDIEQQYNNFILDNIIHINNIIITLDEESQKRYKIITETTWKKGMEDWKRQKKVVYLWDDYDLQQDIQENYYKILKQQYEFYKTTQEAKNSQLLMILENELISIYKKYPYYAAQKGCYAEHMDHEMAQFFANNTQEYLLLKNNYYKILNKIDSQYKKINNIQETRQTGQTRSRQTTARKRTIIEKNAGLIMLGGFVSGVSKGLKNATK